MPVSNRSVWRTSVITVLELIYIRTAAGLGALVGELFFFLRSKFVYVNFPWISFRFPHSGGFANETFRLVETYSFCGVVHILRRAVFRGQSIFIEQTEGYVASLGNAFKLNFRVASILICSFLDCCNVVYVRNYRYPPLLVCHVVYRYFFLSYPVTCLYYIPLRLGQRHVLVLY